jgi:predicted RNA-binding protein with PUA domain
MSKLNPNEVEVVKFGTVVVENKYDLLRTMLNDVLVELNKIPSNEQREEIGIKLAGGIITLSKNPTLRTFPAFEKIVDAKVIIK